MGGCDFHRLKSQILFFFPKVTPELPDQLLSKLYQNELPVQPDKFYQGILPKIA